MTFRRLEIEIGEPLPAVSLSGDEQGWAVLVRRAGRPVAYWIERLAPGTQISAEQLAERIAREGGRDILRQNLESALPQPSTPSLPSLTIAVCTHNRPERLARCLEGIRNLSEPGDLPPVEVLVVDNAPPNDATREVVARYPGVRYAVEPIPGLNFGRNRALAKATGEWIAYLDDDVVPDPIYLEGLVRAWTTNPEARAVTGLVLPFALETEAQILFELAGGFRRGCKAIRYGAELKHNRLYPCGSGIFGAGANMAFHRETLRALGGFDEALDTGPPLPGGGDLDMFFRIIRHGHVLVYEPSVLVRHEHRRELDQLQHQYYTWGLGFMAYVMKHVRTDAELRPRFLSLILWWMRYQARNAKSALRGHHPLPLRMTLAEWAGGIVGMAGEYERSQRRVEERRRAAIETSSQAAVPESA